MTPRTIQLLCDTYGVSPLTIRHLALLATVTRQPMEKIIGHILTDAIEKQDLKWCQQSYCPDPRIH